MGQTHQIKGFLNPGSDVRSGNFSHLEAKGNVLCNSHMRKQCVVLKNHARISSKGRQVRDILAADADFSAIRLEESCNHI